MATAGYRGVAGRAAQWRRRLLRGLALGLAGWLGATVFAVSALRFVDPPTTAFILERRLAAWRKDEKLVVRQRWVPLSAVSQDAQLALVAAEDQKFPTHFGFDVEAIEDALEDRLEGRSKRGASTLTQQVAKNLFLWPGRSFVRKGLEAYFTVLLELLWPKRRILEVHLNVAEYGNGLYGIDAASRAWFGKPPAQLTLDEASRLVAILPSPRTRRPDAPSAAVAERAQWIADQARRLGPASLAGLR